MQWKPIDSANRDEVATVQFAVTAPARFDAARGAWVLVAPVGDVVPADATWGSKSG